MDLNDHIVFAAWYFAFCAFMLVCMQIFLNSLRKELQKMNDELSKSIKEITNVS